MAQHKMSADYLKRELVSHTRKVCSLYKRMMRDIAIKDDDFFEGRYKQLLVRREFDKNKNIKDLRVAKALYIEAERQFTKDLHPYLEIMPYHAYSKEGIAYGRNFESPDFVMDFYHPLEKAQYPYYFAKREHMKDEYIKLWKKKMLRQGESGEKPDRS